MPSIARRDRLHVADVAEHDVDLARHRRTRANRACHGRCASCSGRMRARSRRAPTSRAQRWPPMNPPAPVTRTDSPARGCEDTPSGRGTPTSQFADPSKYVGVLPRRDRILMPDSKKAVILAGGKGTRLGPYTTILPKPLLPVGDQAILEVVVSQLRRHGFGDMVFAVGYLAHLIQAVFGDGSEPRRRDPLPLRGSPPRHGGCAGDVDDLDEPFLLMNGDVLTTLDYDALLQRARRLREHPHDRDEPARRARRLRCPAHGRLGLRRHAARPPLRGEAQPRVRGEHGDLPHGSRSARLHRARRPPRPAEPRAHPDRGGRAGRRIRASRGTGSTSDATRTTSAR